MKRLFFALALVGTLGSFTSCNSGGGSSSYTSTAEYFVDELNDYYDTSYGDEFFLMKEHGEEAYNYAVIYDEQTGNYMAFNLENYYAGMSFDYYMDISDSNDIIHGLDPQGGNLYYSWDYDVYFEETTGTSKDLEKASALVESMKLDKMGDKLAAEFGLSEARGLEVAKLASQWNSLKKKRALTDSDAHAFSKQLIGVDLATATSAFKKSLAGDKSDLDALMEKAAEANETTPERMNQIFNKVLK